MNIPVRIGMDTSKSMFQPHGVDENEVGAVHICNLYSITTNQDAISRLFRVVTRYVGNLAPMPGVTRCQSSEPARTVANLSPDGGEMPSSPLSMRKANLERLLRGRPDGIFVNPFEIGAIGPDLFRAACSLGLEGLVSKRSDRPYRGGRISALD